MSEDKGIVGSSTGITICLGGYQSARVDCWCTLPSASADADETYRKCCDFVSGKVAEEANLIYEENEAVNGQLVDGSAQRQ